MIEFEWQGSTDLDIEIGLAIFKFNGKQIELFLDNFKTAYDLRDFIEHACLESKHKTKNNIVEIVRSIKP